MAFISLAGYDFDSNFRDSCLPADSDQREEMDAEAIASVRSLIQLSSPREMRVRALDMLMEISIDAEGLELFTDDNYAVLDSLYSLAAASTITQEREKILSIVTNLTANSGDVPRAIVKSHADFVKTVVADVIVGDSALRLRSSQLLSNLSHHEPESLHHLLSEHWSTHLVDIFRVLSINYPCAEDGDAESHVDYLGNVLLNLSTLGAVRERITADHLDELIVLLPSSVPFKKRFTAICMLHNLSFDDELHPRLLAEPYDLLSAVVTPLVDEEDELDDDEVMRLPHQLQYHKHRREPSDAILLKSVETLYQFCATTHGRHVLRSKGIYAVLRKLDKATSTPTSGHVARSSDGSKGDFKDTLHALIGVLIRQEGEMGIAPELASIRDLAI